MSHVNRLLTVEMLFLLEIVHILFMVTEEELSTKFLDKFNFEALKHIPAIYVNLLLTSVVSYA